MTDAPPYFQLAAARLYQPDAVLAERLPGGTGELAAYIKTLVWVGTEYFSHYAGAFGSLGLLVAVGIKPSGHTRIWCDPIAGTLPTDVASTFADLLTGAGANGRPQVTAPVALALETHLGNGPSSPFPEIPATWQSAAQSAPSPLTIPDDLLKLIWPN
ncbi:hypothetical protein ACWGID_41400 [Kribbella sp. NPDC054772]